MDRITIDKKLDIQCDRFLKRKEVVSILGDSYKLSTNQRNRLRRLFSVYGTTKSIENMLTTVAYFVFYDLNNYVGRYRRLKGTNGTTTYTQLLRYGTGFRAVYDAQSRRKTGHFENTTQYWIEQGYDIVRAREKVSHIQQQRAHKAAAKLSGTSRYSVRSTEFWLASGYNMSESTEKVRKIQTTNGIDFYKQKFPDDYQERFEKRISGWMESMSKLDQEDLNKKKGHSVEAYQLRGASLEEATEAYAEMCERMRYIRRLPSKISQKMCDMIYQSVTGTCYFDHLNYEYLINGHRVDFFHKESGVVVEFYGDFFHRNPVKYLPESEFHGTRSDERWAYDDSRKQTIQLSAHVTKFIVVWESDFRANPVNCIQQITKEINDAKK